MTPYASYLYFGIVAGVAALPLVGMNLWRRSYKFWILLLCLVMLVIQYGWAMPQKNSLLSELDWLVIYGALEVFVAKLFLQSRRRENSQPVFAAAIALAVSPLVISRIYGGWHHAIGFAGLSYAVFRSIDLLVAIQDRKVSEVGIDELLAYLFFFPTVSSGPIDRFTRFRADFRAQRSWEMFLADANEAVHQIMTGFFYKYILAHYWNKLVLGMAYNHAGNWSHLVYFYGYAIYLFFDFAGYSAFAIGVSYLLGIHTPRNFNQPFLAKNIRDFWNRWHMSLSSWFRDHIYMRFVMGVMKSGRIRNPQVISAAGFMVSFGLMGLWHGTRLHYICYGFYHSCLMIGYEQWIAFKKRRKWVRSRLWTDGLAIVLTFHCVCLGFLIFAGKFPKPKSVVRQHVVKPSAPGSDSSSNHRLHS